MSDRNGSVLVVSSGAHDALVARVRELEKFVISLAGRVSDLEDVEDHVADPTP